MSRRLLIVVASVMFMVTMWLDRVVSGPGVQALAALMEGAAAYATIWLVVLAARADAQVRR